MMPAKSHLWVVVVVDGEFQFHFAVGRHVPKTSSNNSS